MTDCVFCKIIQGAIPSVKIYEDEKFLSIMDTFPASKGHALVITKEHFETFLDVPTDVMLDFMNLVQEISRAVIAATNAQGFKIENFGKKYAGQNVPHFHFHIIPEYEGDGLEVRADKNWWTPRKDLYAAGEKEALAQRIKENL